MVPGQAYSDMFTQVCSSPEICAADSSLGTGSPMGQDSLFMSKVCLPEESGRSMLGPALRMLAGARSPRNPTIVWKGARHCTEGVFQDSEKYPFKEWRRLSGSMSLNLRDMSPYFVLVSMATETAALYPILENDHRPGGPCLIRIF